jgi:hypothetical protein
MKNISIDDVLGFGALQTVSGCQRFGETLSSSGLTSLLGTKTQNNTAMKGSIVIVSVLVSYQLHLNREKFQPCWKYTNKTLRIKLCRKWAVNLRPAEGFCIAKLKFCYACFIILHDNELIRPELNF